MELFAGYRFYDLDRDDQRLDDIALFNIGARFSFDLSAEVPYLVR